jgi:hypothetical protein
MQSCPWTSYLCLRSPAVQQAAVQQAVQPLLLLQHRSRALLLLLLLAACLGCWTGLPVLQAGGDSSSGCVGGLAEPILESMLEPTPPAKLLQGLDRATALCCIGSTCN